MTSLPSLLARIESAIGPDRELDVHIHAALGLNAKYPGNAAVGDLKHWLEFAIHERRESPYHFLGPFTKSKEIGRYTASIDDAIALCEHGWDWYVHKHERDNPPHRHAWAGVRAPASDGRPFGNLIEINARTPALALCAAIIKARMDT